ncbi:MAG: radical SAM protein [Myxococcales bacterium]|nr:radical SAM protein [Myxococcales bacterium]
MSEPRRRNADLLATERAQGRTRLTALPVELQIEATNRCRRRCATCARSYYDAAANPLGDLTPALLDRLAEHFPLAERVLVGGYGEPLLAPLTAAIVARAAAAGCHTVLITGGGDLTAEKARELADVGLGELLLSVDAADDRGMLARRGVTLREVLDNLTFFRVLAPAARAGFNVTLQIDNLDELPRLIEFAAANGAGFVAVHHQKIYTRRQAGQSVLRFPDRAASVFAQAARLAREKNVELALPPLSGTAPCEQPYRLLAVRHDGWVQGCCSAMFVAPLPRVLLGRLPADDLLTLWNAPPLIAARQWTLGEGPADFPCAGCAFRVFTPAAHERFLDGC